MGDNNPEASEWKYLPVRRMALMIEENIIRGLAFAAFEPNDEALWEKVRLAVVEYMQGLFKQGAFQTVTSKVLDAYFVLCDSETNLKNSADSGTVKVMVGFAPLRPAEFVILNIQVPAGQTAT